MAITINGTTGIAGVDGSASTPSLQGADTNTGMFFPAADTIAFAEGGAEVMRIDSSGNVGIGTTSPESILHVRSSNGRIISNASSATGNPSLLLKTSTASNRDWEVYQRYTNGDFGVYDGVGGFDRLIITTAGNLQFNSGYGSVATAYGCRAWVNFNGTGTVAIRGSGNVTSITDNGTGDYTVNFTSAMPDANYAFTQHISCASTGAINDGCDLQSIAAGSFRILCGNGGTALDANYALFSVFR